MTARGKRATIRAEEESTIQDYAVSLFPAMPREQLATKLLAEIKWPGKKKPETEVLQKKISHYRNHAEDDPQDRPWSVTASFATGETQPEAIGDLLSAWKASLVGGRVFTIRQARWVCRLRALFSPGETELLYEKAIIYARYERNYKGKKPEPTTDLDAELAFQRWKGGLHEWEYSQAVSAGVVPLSEGRVKPRYIDAAPETLKASMLPSAWPLPSEYFASAVGRILYETPLLLGKDKRELLREDKPSWWPQAHSVIIFWLRRITNSVKKWQGIDLGYGGPGNPGDKEIAEWEDMARKLISLVIQRARLIDAWQKWQAEDGDFEKLYAGLEQKKLPDIFKELGFTDNWFEREGLREFLSEDGPLTGFLKCFLARLGLDELGNPLKGGQDSEKEAT